MHLMRWFALFLMMIAAQLNPAQAAGENLNGQWSSVTALPIVPSSGGVLPNGKVLLWAADGPTSWANGAGVNHSVLLDLQAGTQQYRQTTLGHNMFCTGTTQLADGRLLINGGGEFATNNGAAATTVYDPVANSFSRVQDMVVPRGYNANTILSDGSAFTLGGSWSGTTAADRVGEIWTPGIGWRTLSGIQSVSMLTSAPSAIQRDWHFWLIPSGNGKVFYAGPSPNLKWLNTIGNGSVSSGGTRGDDTDSVYGTAVMYDADKILKAGGARQPYDTDTSSSAYRIDITRTPIVTKLAPMAYRRSYANSVVLPDGKVLIVGGQTYASTETDSNSVLPAELWNPATGLFSVVAPISIPRNYHSIAFLLPDGRVLSSGGGLCGCSVDHLDYQIYSPPYLFDGSGSIASRPAITNAPTELPYGGVVTVSTDRAVTAFSLVRMAATTHTVNNDQRRLSVTFTTTGTNQYSVNIPANSGHLLPGYWMLFAMDSNGVPSIAKIVHVGPNNIARMVSPPTANVSLGQSVFIQPEVEKLQSFASFGGTGLPPGVSVNPTTGLISGTPTTTGLYSGQLTATDGTRTVSVYVDFDIRVPGSSPPSIVTPSAQSSWRGNPASLAISASDPDGETLTYQATGLPNGLSINAATGMISGSPSVSGTFNPTIKVTDPTGLFATATFSWLVDDTGRYALLNQTSPENQGAGPFTTDAFAPGANALLVAVIGSSYAGTASDPNSLTVNGGGLTWTRRLAVSAANANEAALQIWSAPVTAATPMTLTLDEGADNVYLFMVQVRAYQNYDAANPFGASITNAALSQPAGTMTLPSAPASSSEVIAARVHNSAGGTFTSATPGVGWTELYDVYPYLDGTGLQSEVRTASASQTVNWVDVNDSHMGTSELVGAALEVRASSGPVNNPPVITTPVAQSTVKGTSVNLAISASDPDGNTLTYSATGLPAGLTINATTGVITGSPTTAGNYNPTVRATDPGTLFAQASFAWTVTNPNNQAPSITVPGTQVTSVGIQVSLPVTASDPDGDTLAFSATGLPGGLSINTSTGVISGTVSAVGSFNSTIRATDSGGLFASGTVQWNVADIVPSVTSLPVSPRQVATSVSYAPAISNSTGVIYSWDFADGTAATSFNASPNISHTFAAPGVFTVVLTMKNLSGNLYTYQFLQAIHTQPGALGVASSALAYEDRATGGARLWVANPDNNSVGLINALNNTALAEIAVGQEPVAVARHGSGTIWVVNRKSATISVIDPVSLAITSTIALPRGSRPAGLVFAGTSGDGFVTLEAKGQLASVTPAGVVTVRSSAADRSRFLSANGAKNTLYLSNFVTPPLPGESGATVSTADAAGNPLGGQVFEMDTAGALRRTIVLKHSETPDSEFGGKGIPNYLRAAAPSPDGASLWVPSKQDNIKRGTLRNGLNLNFQNTVRAIVSRIDVATGQEDLASRIDLDNSGLAAAIAFHPTGAFMFVALPASREVAIVDPVGRRELFRFAAGRAPSSLALSADGTRLFVGNFMDRTVTAVSLLPLLASGQRSVNILATIPTIAIEALAPNVLRGKQLFYDAADPRLARDAYISCAACHDGGETDGRTWDFTGFGEGVRNTVSLIGRGGMSQGFLHWSANFDEVQDFEGQIRNLNGGTGLMSDTDFFANNRSAPLGGPKAGLSSDLDALATYVTSLTEVPLSPFRNANGTLTRRGSSGRTLFTSAGCGSCHAGNGMTISADATQLKNIGTITAASGGRLGGPLTGIDVPTLRGVWATAPYLHDGSASLSGAVTAHSGVSLTATQLTNIVEYLKQVEQIP